MNARHPLLFAALVVSLPLALAGCGNKGPLVMAGKPAAIEEPETPAGSVPVEIVPQQTLPVEEPAGALADPTADAPALIEPASTEQPATDRPAAVDPRIPIDPASVPDSPPATGTADDGDG